MELHELGCDAYAASLHKWLLAPIGTGVMYVKMESREQWRSVFDEISTLDQPNYAPTGTVALPVRAAIAPALSLIERSGIETIARRNRLLSDYLKDLLGQMTSVSILSGPSPETSAPGSTIFEIAGVDPIRAVATLAAEGLHIDEHARDGHNAMRNSTHFYNTTSEIDHAVAALNRLEV